VVVLVVDRRNPDGAAAVARVRSDALHQLLHSGVQIVKLAERIEALRDGG
jgi:hypothetical protein